MKEHRRLTVILAFMAALFSVAHSFESQLPIHAATRSVGVDPAVTVTTGPASNITCSSVTMNGSFTIVPEDGASVVSFDLRKSGTTGWTTVWQVSSLSTFPISYTYSPLLSDTQYEYRMWVGPNITSAWAFGQTVTFTTSRPTVNVRPATNVNVSESSINAELLFTGNCEMWGYFEYGETVSYGQTTYQTNNWLSHGAQSFRLTGLKGNTTYHYRLYVRHYASGQYVQYYSQDGSFTTLSPDMAILPATNITVSSATISANLNWSGGATFWGYFEYGLTTSYGQTTAGTNNWQSAGTQTANISGLKAGSTYHYRLMSKYGEQYFYSPDGTFNTLSPVVTTGTASNTTISQSTLNGTVSWTGAKNFDVVFEYGPTVSYGTQVIVYPSQSGPVSSNVTGLHSGTAYHYRLIVKQDTTVFAGQDAAFTTLAPAVTTSAASGVGNSSANLNGSVTFTGPSSVTPGFDYGTTTSYGSTVSAFTMISSGDFGWTLSELSAGTTYHYRAKVTTVAGDIYYGSDMTFTTTTAPPAFLFKWGSQGPGDGQINQAYGIAVDATGNVYVADTNNHRVQKFSNTGAFITKWGSHGSGDGQFNAPMGIAVDASGIYVADQNNQRIQKFSSTGNFITKWGSLGSQDGQFNNPGYIALDATGNLYVEDQTNQRIQKFSSAGAFITKWGSAGNDDGQFANLNGIAVDSAGNVYVSDLYHYRIQKFSSTGAFITKWGSQGSGDGQFYYPQGIATDQYGYVYVADVNNHRVQKFTSTGAFVTKWGSSGSGDGQFNSPRAVTVDSANKVHVVDFYNYRIQVFGVHTPPIVATDAATSVGSSTATLNGNLNAMGTTTTVNVSFEYGATTSYGTATTAQARTTTGTFSAVITGLSGNTTYHYRAKADGGAAGTANGADTTFTTLAGLVSETSATAVSDVDGIIRISANINRVKDPSTGQTAVLPGGLGSFSFSVSTAPSNSATFATTAIALASSQSSWNPNTGIFTVSGILNPAQPNSSSVARIAPRLVGDCITPVTITIAFQNITGAGGSSAPEESPNSLSFRRGDVNGNGTVDIFDAMYIAQYIVGVRPASQINFVNAACIKHDGTDGDKLDIFDAMYIAQMVVGLRNNRFE